ncbi:unnamed protein product [Sphagnum balticum]
MIALIVAVAHLFSLPAYATGGSLQAPASTRNEDAHAGLTGDDPQVETSVITDTLPNGDVLTIENTIVSAEGEAQIARADQDYVTKVNAAAAAHDDITVVATTTDTAESLADAAKMRAALKVVPDEHYVTTTIETSVVKRASSAFKNLGAKIRDSKFVHWMNKAEPRPRAVTAIGRLLFNGTTSAWLFMHTFGVNPADGTGLLFAVVGFMCGSVSAFLSFKSPSYSRWLQRGVSDKTFAAINKVFPWVKRQWLDEIKKSTKWTGLEFIFWVIPKIMFEHLPAWFDGLAQHLAILQSHAHALGSSVHYSSSWEEGLAKCLVFLLGGLWSQYFWDYGTSAAFDHDEAKAKRTNDNEFLGWVNTRTYFTYLFVSMAQVPIAAMSIGHGTLPLVAGWSGLGLMGLAGLFYRKKVMTRVNAEEAEALKHWLISHPTECDEALTPKAPPELYLSTDVAPKAANE